MSYFVYQSKHNARISEHAENWHGDTLSLRGLSEPAVFMCRMLLSNHAVKVIYNSLLESQIIHFMIMCFCRRIVDDGVKENGFSIITENRTYHVIAESTNDWK